MKKVILSLLFFVFTSVVFSQIEKYPVFGECSSIQISELKQCFNNKVKGIVSKEFRLPQKLKKEGFSDTVNVVFLVKTSGEFQSIYVNSPYLELKQEIERVFENFPKVTPAKYNNHPIEMQFVLPLKIPFDDFNEDVIVKKEEVKNVSEKVILKNTEFKL